jgi:hypothetical protein
MTAAVKPHLVVAVVDPSEIMQHRPAEETEPVTTTVDHADIRGLVTTLLVSVEMPASV